MPPPPHVHSPFLGDGTCSADAFTRASSAVLQSSSRPRADSLLAAAAAVAALAIGTSSVGGGPLSAMAMSSSPSSSAASPSLPILSRPLASPSPRLQPPHMAAVIIGSSSSRASPAAAAASLISSNFSPALEAAWSPPMPSKPRSASFEAALLQHNRQWALGASPLPEGSRSGAGIFWHGNEAYDEDGLVSPAATAVSAQPVLGPRPVRLRAAPTSSLTALAMAAMTSSNSQSIRGKKPRRPRSSIFNTSALNEDELGYLGDSEELDPHSTSATPSAPTVTLAPALGNGSSGILAMRNSPSPSPFSLQGPYGQPVPLPSFDRVWRSPAPWATPVTALYLASSPPIRPLHSFLLQQQRSTPPPLECHRKSASPLPFLTQPVPRRMPAMQGIRLSFAIPRSPTPKPVAAASPESFALLARTPSEG
ncbi:hypothetical protein BC828DRAFT_408602 [Blastocladiella britannica]|nr:hypothetical protein BC828DRAFT_408602 [Blastocladiella britannica]